MSSREECKICGNYPRNCWCFGKRRDLYMKELVKRPPVGQLLTSYRTCVWCRSKVCLCNISTEKKKGG